MARNRLFVLVLLVLFGLLAFQAEADIEVEENPVSITILASSSLTDVMSELTRVYSKRSGHTVAASFASPAELVRSIEQGEPADFFISEDQPGMITLKRKGLIDVFTISNIAQDRLVLVASADHYLSKYVHPASALPRLLSDLNERVMLVMGDPDEVPVGMRAKEALNKLGKWENIEPFIVRTENNRSARYLIAKGRNAGVTYYTEAYKNPEVKILSEFPSDSYSSIIYQAAVVAGLHMAEARSFLDFLKSGGAKNIFEKHGFMIN